MELLTCPACGCSIQVADAVLGRRVRCIGCKHSFVAEAGLTAPPPARRETPPVARATPRADAEETLPGEGSPYCPGCGRRINWIDPRCPHCGEEFEPEDPARSRRLGAELVRRDYEPHRGTLILSLGNVSLIVGALSLCTFGLGAVVSLPVGILAWLMAHRDLERMREGLMDPRGQGQTETGRIGAVAGILFGLIFGAFYALVYLAG